MASLPATASESATATPQGGGAEAQGRPQRRGGAFSVGTTAVVAVVVLLSLYVLSIGPVGWWYGSLALHGIRGQDDDAIAVLTRFPRKFTSAGISAPPRRGSGPPPDGLVVVYAPLVTVYFAVPALQPVLHNYLAYWNLSVLPCSDDEDSDRFWE